MNKLYEASSAFIDGAVGLGGYFRPTSSWTSLLSKSKRLQLIHIHTTRQGLDVLKKMLPWLRTQQARGLRRRNDAQVCYRGRGRMPEQDKKAIDMQTIQDVYVLLWPKDSTILNSIDLNRRSPSLMIWWGRRHH